MKNREKVLVVGAGPTGLTLTAKLAKQGIKCALIDKREKPSELLKALVISMASLHYLDDIGISEKLMREGRLVPMLTIYWNKKRLMNVSYKYLQSPYNKFVHITQPLVESHLLDYLAKHDIAPQRGVELIDLEQEHKKVKTVLKNKAGVFYEQEFDYVIGCDGGKSTVREKSGILYDNEQYGSYFILADVILDWDAKTDQTHYFLTEQGYLMLVPGPFGQHRIIGSYKGECSDREPKLEKFVKLLTERCPGKAQIKKLIWSTSAPFYHQISHQNKKGNVLLAGDAYHLFSPVGGVNMNVGISDAHQLALILTNIYNDKGSNSALDDYSAKRQQEINKILSKTKTFTELVTQMAYHPVAEKFEPDFSNRSFIRHELPFLFSGFSENELKAMIA